MKPFIIALHRNMTHRLSELRTRLNATAYTMPSSSAEWKELDNLIAWVEQTGELCRSAFDTPAAAWGASD
jgi:hypothetical protein